MEREIFEVPEEEIDDFTNENCIWKINGQKYKFIEDVYFNECDGEGHRIITKRQSDKKYFKFEWSYYHDTYYYYPEWKEVIPTTITKTIYGWKN